MSKINNKLKVSVHCRNLTKKTTCKTWAWGKANFAFLGYFWGQNKLKQTQIDMCEKKCRQFFLYSVQFFCSSSSLTEISIRFEFRVSSFLFLSANVTIFVTSALIHDRHTVQNEAKVFFEVAFEVNLEFFLITYYTLGQR